MKLDLTKETVLAEAISATKDLKELDGDFTVEAFAKESDYDFNPVFTRALVNVMNAIKNSTEEDWETLFNTRLITAIIDGFNGAEEEDLQKVMEDAKVFLNMVDEITSENETTEEPTTTEEKEA